MTLVTRCLCLSMGTLKSSSRTGPGRTCSRGSCINKIAQDLPFWNHHWPLVDAESTPSGLVGRVSHQTPNGRDATHASAGAENSFVRVHIEFLDALTVSSLYTGG